LSNAINNPDAATEQEIEFFNRVNALWEEYKEKSEEKDLASLLPETMISDETQLQKILSEFIAHMYNSTVVRENASKMKVDGISMFQRFIDAIRSLFGLSQKASIENALIWSATEYLNSIRSTETQSSPTTDDL
jgi:hypothetical protein